MVVPPLRLLELLLVPWFLLLVMPLVLLLLLLELLLPMLLMPLLLQLLLRVIWRLRGVPTCSLPRCELKGVAPRCRCRCLGIHAVQMPWTLATRGHDPLLWPRGMKWEWEPPLACPLTPHEQWFGQGPKLMAVVPHKLQP